MERAVAGKMDNQQDEVCVERKKDVKLVNLTHRTVVILSHDYTELLRLNPSGTVASCEICPTITDYINGIPVGGYTYKAVRGVPSPKNGVVYVVTYAVLQALGGSRQDVVSPDTSQDSVVRDGKGVVRGVLRFRR